ncbi:MAG: endonuclease Q family protein [Patescibacteria group bacterium]|nr:endonuclease Q family protein [Patescibacteria group bacterium]
MQIIADLQLHSKYSRAVSKDMTIPGIYTWAIKKGIHLVATGDWTHPLWMKEIEEHLEETGHGTLRMKSPVDVSHKTENDPLFLLATEVSCIFSQGGKGRRVHTLVWVPTLESARKINKEMTRQGCNLMSDGRPIIGLSSIQLAELVLSIEERALLIPAHAWTPWFGAYGSMSGFDSLEEQFGPYADKIYAVETGLSSNPAMNWQIQELDTRTIVSFSDAHSGPKMGREATVFEIDPSISNITYDHIYKAITAYSSKYNNQASDARIAYTIEFYPEEGKYHFSGHRTCKIRWGPNETQQYGSTCPVCGKTLTQGVVQRVEELAARNEESLQLKKIKNQGLLCDMICSEVFPYRPPFIMLVPLQEIITECIESPITSKKTLRIYDQLLQHFQNEFSVLLHTSIEDIERVAGGKIAQGIDKVRKGDIVIDPGYDGVFGVVKIWKNDEERSLVDESKKQLSLL